MEKGLRFAIREGGRTVGRGHDLGDYCLEVHQSHLLTME